MKEKYFLTLRLQKGNEVKIDISLLEIAKGYFPKTLEEIDNFTLNFTQEELIKEIDKANIADNYLEGLLCITDNAKHILPVLTKDYVQNFNIYNYLMANISNKTLMNNLINKYQNYGSEADTQNFKKMLKVQNVDESYKLINKLAYFKRRKLLCYLIENVK